MDGLYLIEGSAIYMLASHLLLLCVGGWKFFDLFHPASAARWGAPPYPEQFAGDELAQSEALARLERGVWLFGFAAASFPFIGLAGTVYEVSDALGRLGAGLQVEQLSIPLGKAIRFTFHGIIGAVLALGMHQLFNRRLDVLEQRAHFRHLALTRGSA